MKMAATMTVATAMAATISMLVFFVLLIRLRGIIIAVENRKDLTSILHCNQTKRDKIISRRKNKNKVKGHYEIIGHKG